ncbi:hypothetical protein A3Q56_05083 [Intoshia linei]|uniref:Uncharacterized protein n=1 Tax=Intoshia linei TaxID=1819745 RepID=A0A177AYX0_9BILA|nr:hypothetical protein A3Q56_05083 [Intoshia linei]
MAELKNIKLSAALHHFTILKPVQMNYNKKKSNSNDTEYLNSKFIVPTFDMIEKFFNVAEFTYTNLKKRLLPSNLENHLFLKLNKKFWDTETIQNMDII